MILLNQQKQKKSVAVINIGSHTVKLVVANGKNNSVHKLDTLQKPIPLGHEVFHTGTISFECLKELCTILHNYQAVMEEYDVKSFLVIATSALREAKNQQFVLDQIKVKTGMSVVICDDTHEKALISFEVLGALERNNKVLYRKTLISHTGTGSTGLSLYEDGAITFSQTLSMGSLKIHDMLGNLDSSAFDEAAEEYLDAVFSNVVMPFPSQMIDSLVMTGTEMDFIAKLCGAKAEDNVYHVSGDAMKALFHQVKKSSLSQLSLQYNMDEERAEILYASLSIFFRLFQLTQAEEILIPKITLSDSYLRRLLFQNWTEQYSAFMEKSAIACAKTFGERYHCDPLHYSAVSDYSVKIFDRLRRLHGFTNRHRTILQVASILHDGGYFVNAKGGCASSLLRNIEICGLSNSDMQLVSFIANFNELLEPDFGHPSFCSFTEEELLLCSKLTAIFRLANALDKSRKQKLRELRVKLRGDELILSATCDQNLYLEQWAVQRCGVFFQEAFGIHPVLQIKSTML